jgi:prevent-host-death family protein
MTSKKRESKFSPSSPNPKRRRGSSERGRPRREVALARVKDDLSKYLRLAAREEIVITRHGRPAGVLIGFGSDEDWLEYRLAHHPEFLRHVAEARAALRQGLGVRLEDVEDSSK